MKKLSIVLLALLLIGGMAFAAELALSGEVSANFGLDFDNEEYGLYHADTNEINLSFAASSSATGEGDVYAEIVLDGAAIAIDTHSDDDEAVTWSGTLGGLSATVYAGDFSVALSSATAFGNAASTDANGEDTANPDFGAGTGVTLKYMDASVGFDYWTDPDDSDDNDASGDAVERLMIYGGYAMSLTEELTIGLDAAYSNEDVFGSLTAAYAMDDYSVSAAVDMQNVANTFAWDAALSASAAVADVTADLDVYFNGDFDVMLALGYTGVENLTVGAGFAMNDNFTAVAAVDEVEAVDAGFAWADANNDGVADAGEWSPVAAVEAVDAVEAVEAWSVSFDAAYAIDNMAPYVSLGYNASETFSLEVGANLSIVDNASVNINYTNGDLAADKGAVNASIVVSL